MKTYFFSKIKPLISVMVMALVSCNANEKENQSLLKQSDDIAMQLAEEYHDVSLYYATLPDYHVSEIPISMGGPIIIGRGVKLPNAYSPILQNSKLVDVKTIDVSNSEVPQFSEIKTMTSNNYPKVEIPISNVRSSTVWDYFNGKSTTDKARSLNANFGTSIFGSIEASYSQIEKYSQTGVFLMAQGTQILTDTKLPVNSSINSNEEAKLKKIENLPDIIERSSKLFENYGTHYISEITYGYRFTFVARSETANKEIQEDASFKFQNMIAKLSIETKDRSFFTENKIAISATVVGGYNDAPNIFLTSIEEIAKFLSDINDGTKKLYYAPIGFKLKSYNHLLFSTEYPNLYALTTPNLGDRASSDFGVPKGTIIAWYPSSLGTLKKDNIDIESVIPKGWALCDGSPGTPDLRANFIMGTHKTSEIAESGGSTSHNHSGITENAQTYADGYEIDGDRGSPAAAGLNHMHKIKESNHLPPFIKMVYLIKV